jgi:hypothetical protein
MQAICLRRFGVPALRRMRRLTVFTKVDYTLGALMDAIQIGAIGLPILMVSAHYADPMSTS